MGLLRLDFFVVETEGFKCAKLQKLNGFLVEIVQEKIVFKTLIISILSKNIRNYFLYMALLAQFPCSNGGLRPSARLKRHLRRAKPRQQPLRLAKS